MRSEKEIRGMFKKNMNDFNRTRDFYYLGWNDALEWVLDKGEKKE